MNTQNIISSISRPRISTYEAACPQNAEKSDNALTLYAWNARVSAAMLAPLHLCEVVTRNAVSDALESVYGARWPWSSGFEQSLPSSRGGGYDPSRDLFNARRRQTSTGKVIPELKFVFWQKLFTSRFQQRIWTPHIKGVFPNLPANKTEVECRTIIYDELESIRKLRNRIAHHEPIFSRNLLGDYTRICSLVQYRCVDTESWMKSNQNSLQEIQTRPQF